MSSFILHNNVHEEVQCFLHYCHYRFGKPL